MSDVSARLDAAIKSAIGDGILDERRHGPLIESARICARSIDSSEEPTAAMLTTMLNYCRTLGIAPTNTDIDRRRKPQGKTSPSKLEEARARRFMAAMREKCGNRTPDSSITT